MNILVCSLTGMAELHPEECRSRFYRVGQRRQVGHAHLPRAVFSPHSITSLSFQSLPTSNFSNFAILPSHHSPSGPQDPQGPCDRVAISDSGGGGLEGELGRVRMVYL